MIVGIGVDIVDIEHMAKVVQKTPRIVEKILTVSERVLYKKRSEKRQLEFLAGRYAAKEAFSKAMGTGIGQKVTFQNVSILNDNRGCPYIVESPFKGRTFISISHSKKSAIAQVVLEED